jgi:hypothetical protein
LDVDAGFNYPISKKHLCWYQIDLRFERREWTTNYKIFNIILLFRSDGDWACNPMVGQSSKTPPTRVQILVLTPFPGCSRIYRRYALSGKRRSHRRRDNIGDFGNLQICRCSVLRRCS